MNEQENYTCPVCGLILDFKPWLSEDSASDEICPCCCTQFGYYDVIRYEGNKEKTKENYLQLRNNWIKDGMMWWSKSRIVPENWNPVEQLKNIPKEWQ